MREKQKRGFDLGQIKMPQDGIANISVVHGANQRKKKDLSQRENKASPTLSKKEERSLRRQGKLGGLAR